MSDDIDRLQRELQDTEQKIAQSSAGTAKNSKDVRPPSIQQAQSSLNAFSGDIDRDARIDRAAAPAGGPVSPTTPATSTANIQTSTSRPTATASAATTANRAKPTATQIRNNGSTSGQGPQRPGSQPVRLPQGGVEAAQQTRTPARSDASNGTGQSSRELGIILSDLTQDQGLLLQELIEINGQDSYDAVAAGVGKLRSDEYLVLPLGISSFNIPAEEVGKPAAHERLAYTDWGNIYSLNKAIAPPGVDPATFGLLRLEAVKAGWVKDMREVRYENAPVDGLTELITDMQTLREKTSLIKTASFLLPLVAEHTFRTMGHHFISSDQANYVQRYEDTFKSCLFPDISRLLPPAALYHTALHWVGPGRAREVLMAQLDTPQIPDALRIRANAAPAGTAILTTTNAILEAMATVNLDQAFETYGSFGLGDITAVTEAVKKDPVKYHKSYFAYNVAKPTAQEIGRLEAAKKKAERFAPYAQAFIDTYMREAALGKAKAIKKHADGNPIQLRRATTLFRAISRAKVTSVEDLIRAQLTVGTNVDD